MDAIQFYIDNHSQLIHCPDHTTIIQTSCGIIDSCGVEYLIQCRSSTPALQPAKKLKTSEIHTSLMVSSKSAMIAINFDKFRDQPNAHYFFVPIGKIYQYNLCIRDVEVVVKTNAEDAEIDLAHIRLIA